MRRRDLLRAGATAAGLAATTGCTTVIARNAAPPDSLESVAPYGIRHPTILLREWGDEIGPEIATRIVARRAEILRQVFAAEVAAGRPLRETSLLLSGGGPDGAFGAGLLAGWTARGDRPRFDIVTGISTGAIIALFAFLGPEHDATLREIYTTFRTEQLLTPALLTALTGGSAITDARGYRGLIERYVTEDVVRTVAQEAQRGRALLIGTTNIDAARPVFWNMGGIAATGHPMALRLFHDVIQASSAIPAVFPPVLIPVETVDGRGFDEMHVDGGATQQIMFFSPSVPMTLVDEAVGVRIQRTVYAVVNNKLRKPYAPVRPRVLAIAGTAASSLLGGAGGGDLYKIFAIAQRDGMDLNVVAIPTTFDAVAAEPFDPVYMGALYRLGYEYGEAGDRWRPVPPDFAPGAPRRR